MDSELQGNFLFEVLNYLEKPQLLIKLVGKEQHIKKCMSNLWKCWLTTLIIAAAWRAWESPSVRKTMFRSLLPALPR